MAYAMRMVADNAGQGDLYREDRKICIGKAGVLLLLLQLCSENAHRGKRTWEERTKMAIIFVNLQKTGDYAL